MIAIKPESLTIRLSLLIFAFWITFFALILINGYALNLVGLPANAYVILILLLAEIIFIARGLRANHLRVQVDPLELAGFLLVVAGTWLYFVYASLPTLLPPTYSGDAANHLAFTDTIFSSEQIFSNYRGGPSLTAATLAHLIGWLPIRIIHPLASSWIARTAGGVYGLACDLLSRKPFNKTVALLAVAWLYVSPDYFAGQLIGANYFLTQVAAQLFIIAFVWFLVEYFESRDSLWLLGMALCLIAISVSFQLWIALPPALFLLAMLNEWRSG